MFVEWFWRWMPSAVAGWAPALPLVAAALWIARRGRIRGRWLRGATALLPAALAALYALGKTGLHLRSNYGWTVSPCGGSELAGLQSQSIGISLALAALDAVPVILTLGALALASNASWGPGLARRLRRGGGAGALALTIFWGWVFFEGYVWAEVGHAEPQIPAGVPEALETARWALPAAAAALVAALGVAIRQARGLDRRAKIAGALLALLSVAPTLEAGRWAARYYEATASARNARMAALGLPVVEGAAIAWPEDVVAWHEGDWRFWHRLGQLYPAHPPRADYRLIALPGDAPAALLLETDWGWDERVTWRLDDPHVLRLAVSRPEAGGWHPAERSWALGAVPVEFAAQGLVIQPEWTVQDLLDVCVRQQISPCRVWGG